MLGTLASLLLITVIGYLWGSIPSGYWMGKLLRGRNFDIRVYGSHKTGATNVRRILGNIPAGIVLIVDISKGIGPTLLATLPFFYHAGWGPALAGMATLLGHCFPIFINFRGGRGVLTGLGALLVLSPLATLIGASTAVSAIVIWRYVSLGSIVGSIAVFLCGLIFATLGWVNPPYVAYMLIGPPLVIFFHRDNITRLLAGTERKLGQKEGVATSTPSSEELPTNV
ncbi:MAG: glycerol-3-phosphate 1-O-acyltransferase PlsY [Ktedonobacteraceae bacterium]|nr:glycerol-3-phosphate 1-O-acyltransferase PlsY [Ktedonobacteraceae bacterium]